jgi:hypothetical protein
MLGKSVWLIGLILLIVPLVSANTNCSGSLLWSEKTYVIGNGTNEVSLSVNETTTCEAGCAENGLECKTPLNVPAEFYSAAGFGVAFMAALLAYLGTKVSNEHGSLQFLFFGASILSLIMLMGILSGYGMFNQSQILGTLLNGLQVAIVVFILVTAYFIIKMITSAVVASKVKA